MVKLAGLWELGWNTPIKEMDLWEYPLKDFGVDQLIMSPISGIYGIENLVEVPDLTPVIAEHRQLGYTVIFVDEFGTSPLETFTHPENALYVFGKASMSAKAAYSQEGDVSVVISTPNNSGLLWPHQAAIIMLYDRHIKASK